MTDAPTKSIARAVSLLALAVASGMVFTSCGAAQFVVTLRELRVVQQEVSKIAGTGDVSVDLQNGHVLSVTIGNSNVIGEDVAGRKRLSRRVASAAYLAYPSRSRLEALTVMRRTQTRHGLGTDTVTTDSQLFRPIELVDPGDVTEHWVKPPEASNRLYLVAVGNVQRDLVNQLVTHFRRTLGISVEELPAFSLDRVAVDTDRSQVVAEDILATIARRFPELARDAYARVIGVTGDDMRLRTMRFWAFGFSLRSDDDQMAVVSYTRMDPIALGLPADPEMLKSRVIKMVAKNIGVLYYGLPLSNNPRSVLYGNIGGTDELDVMTEYFDPR